MTDVQLPALGAVETRITEKSHLRSATQRLSHCAMKGRWALGLGDSNLAFSSAIYGLRRLRQAASSL